MSDFINEVQIEETTAFVPTAEDWADYEEYLASLDTRDEYDEEDWDDYDDGQPDEMTEWLDFDPYCQGSSPVRIADLNPCHVRTYGGGAGRVDLSRYTPRTYVNKKTMCGLPQK